MVVSRGFSKHAISFFPNRIPQEVQRRWALIKHRSDQSGAEAQHTIATEEPREEMNQDPERLGLEIARSEEAAAFGVAENWLQFHDWD
jgi:hypothetical protein